ncbi:desulfoferrodoxin family protein [Parvibacter caecicola]|uniref:Desulfoferrodoxin n=1 Tax=Parvibacter caecicola TaxID=747645 RepID=A0A3N0A7M5_9ACTN|nr:desulfoferrodoxin family protein [Parvibacter caecicola]MBB3170909.1 superoxide reductase [Parvibacter caecicola]MCR2042351.1 desulfoferrodoxin family protein [Parvibacter caecicola]RNL09094.1 desulfoferrodoxin [Parvibacter caecicola]TJW09440.1 desulfoferrodoxin [Parvibacter caecicola]
MEIKFYKCNHCGNIAVKVVDKGVPLVCCGEKMVEMVPDSVDAATEKHVPAVTREEGHIHVNVGSVDHPMTPEHWIQFICLLTDAGYDIHPLTPENAPSTDFFVPATVKPLAVYEYCNLHGLWVTEL